MIDDWVFLLESGIIEKDLIKSDACLFRSLKEMYASAKQELKNLERRATEAMASGSETVSQRRNRNRKKREREREREGQS